MDFIQTFKNYLFSLKPVPSVATVKNYAVDVSHFISWYETSFSQKFDPSEISLATIQNFQKDKATQISARSLERHLSSLRKFFHSLKLQGVIAASPFEQQSVASSQQIVDSYHLREFKDFLYVYNASNLTIKNYIIDVRQFLKWLEEVTRVNDNFVVSQRNPLDYLTSKLVNEYKARLVEQKIFSPASINRKLSSLRKYLSWAQSQDLIKSEHSFTINPNEIENVPSTLESFVPKDSKGQGESVNREEIENQTLNDSRLTVNAYSSFPPFRLFQKISKGINYAFDAALIIPLASLVAKVHTAIWITRGKPLFVATKRISNIKYPISNIQYQISKQFSQSNFHIKNITKALYAPVEVSTTHFPWYKKAFHHIRYTRPNWYRRYHNTALSHYFNWAVLMIFCAIIGYGLYTSFFQNPNQKNPALAALPNAPLRILSFQGRLTDTNDNPITSPTWLRFVIYNDSAASGSARLWEEERKVSPDTDGIFSVLLGSDGAGGQASLCNGGNPPTSPATGACGIPNTLFANNNALWMGITVEQTPELTPRQQLATVAFASNSETLQGLPPITAAGAGTQNVVLALDSSGNLGIGASTTFQSTSGTFTLAGNTVVVNTNAGSNGNIKLAPDGFGTIDLEKPLVNNTLNNNIPSAAGSVEVDDLFSVLATSSGQSAVTINQNGTGPIISASSSGNQEFTVSNGGVVTASSFLDLQNTTYFLDPAAGGTSLNVAGDGVFGGNITANRVNVGNTTTYYIDAVTSNLNALTVNGNLTLAGSSEVASNLIPAANDTYDLGSNPLSAGHEWNNLYVKSIFLNGVLLSGTNLWQRNAGVLSPTNITDDLTLGGTSTTSAIFGFLNVAAGTPTATISSNFSIQVPKGANPGVTINAINGGQFTFQTATTGKGDVGLTSQFAIANNGALTANGTSLTIGNGNASTITTTNANLNLNTGSGTLTLNNAGSGAINFFSGSNSLASSGNLTIAGTATVNGTGASEIVGTLGIGASPLTATALDIEKDTLGNAALLVHETSTSNVANLIVASNSAGTQFIVSNNGNITGNRIFVGEGTTYYTDATTSNLNALTLNGNLILAGTAQVASNLIPSSNDTFDLGSNPLSAGHEWNNLYVKNIFENGVLLSGANLWQRNAGVLSPYNITDDLTLGGTSSSSAIFGFLNNTGSGSPTATISSNFSIVIPTGATPSETINVLNGGNLNIQRSVGGDAGVTTSLFVDKAGNIGVGTNNPTQTLDVNGTAEVEGNFLYIGGTTYFIKGNTSGSNIYALGLNRSNGTAYTSPDVYSNGNGLVIGGNSVGANTVALNTSSSLTPTEYLKGSFVGINTTSSGNSALAVNQTNTSGLGDIFTASTSGTTKFIITNSGSVGIGDGITDASLLSPTGLDIEKNSQGNAALVVRNLDTLNKGDIFTASNSAGTKVTIANNGNVNFNQASTIGVTPSNTGLTVNSNGTGTLLLDSTGAGTVTIGTNATTINVGQSNTATTLAMASGTGANVITLGNNQTVGSIALGNAMTTGTITLGGSSTTGTITVGQYTGGSNSTINIGHATVGAGANQTIGIGDSASGTGIDTITVGNTNGASVLNLKAGTGGLSLVGAPININTSGTGNILIGNGTGSLTLTLGSDARGDMYYRSNAGTISRLPIGLSTQCLIGGLDPTWGSCGTGTNGSFWTLDAAKGDLYPVNSTVDMLVGGTATTSAKFAILNMTGSGNPTASVSSGLSGNGIYMDATGTIQTVRNQALTLGGTTTGNIILAPLGGTTGSTVSINAGTVDDSQATATLFGTPTNITLAGNATTLTIGAAGAGTTTFRNNTIDDNQATLGLFATPTTINFAAGATTAINIGATNTPINLKGSVTIGTTTAQTVTINGLVNQSILPSTTSINLGDPTHYWGTVYAQNFIAPVSGGTSGFWALTNNVLSPVNPWNDLAVGGQATASATPWQVFATTVGIDTAGTATSSGGLSFRGTSTNVALLNGSVLNFQTSVGGDSGLSTVLTLANNGNLTQTGNFTTSGTVAANGGTLSTSQSTFNLVNTSATTINFGAAASVALNVGNSGGLTTLNGNLQLGTSTSNTINPVGKFSGSLIPNATTVNLGSSANPYGNLFLASSANYGGLWQQFSGTLSPLNITDDVLIGGTSTASALIKFAGQTNGNSWFNTGGNVGIGTTSPKVQFEVQSTTGGLIRAVQTNGSGSIGSELMGDGGAANSFRMGLGNNLYWNGSNWVTETDGGANGGTLILSGYGPSDLGFYTLPSTGGGGGQTISNSSLANDLRVIFKENGSVGVGTASPLAMLDVRGSLTSSPIASFSGTTSASGLVIDNAGTGDFLDINSAGKALIALTQFGTGGRLTLTPEKTDAYDIGTDPNAGGFEWNNLYVRQIFASSTGGVAGYWQLNNGALAPTNITNDVLVGGIATSSATFHVYGSAIGQGTVPVATIAANTSFAGLVVDNKGTGDVFTASTSGLDRFVVKQNGNVGINIDNPTQTLDVAGDFQVGKDATAWGVSGYSYRRQVSITNNSGGTLTNYQVKMVVDTATLIAAGKITSSACNDIRFTDTDGSTNLNYWIENGCNTNYTTIWVNVPTIGYPNKTIYMYYGKSGASAASSTTNTFIQEITGVQAAYRLDEPTYDPIVDYSTNGNVATGSGTTVVTGKFGNARSFNGTYTDFITASDSASLRQATPMTISAWFKTSTTGVNQRIIGKATTTGTLYAWALFVSSTNQVVAEYYNGTDFTTTSKNTYTDGNWHYAVLSISGTSLNLSVDTNAEKPTTITGTQGVPTGEMDIGAAAPFIGATFRQNFFNGSIDELRVYNASLSAQTVSTIYGTGGNVYGYVSTNNPNKEELATYTANPPGTYLNPEQSVLQTIPSFYVQNTTGNVALGTLSVASTSARLTIAGDLKSGFYDTTAWGANFSGYSYRARVLVDNTKSASDSANYIVQVKTNTNAPIVNGKIRSDCGDIRFADSDGNTSLSYWIETGTCNSTSTVIDVKVPYIPGSASKNIYMYYGNPSVVTTSSTGIFIDSTISGVQGAWRLDETTATTATDYSGNGNNGTTTGTVAQGGVFNNARYFNGVGDSVNVGTGTWGIPDNTSTHVSLGAWVNVATFTSFPTILGKLTGVSPYGGYEINIESGGKFDMAVNAGGSWDVCTSTGTYKPGVWYYVTGTYDGTLGSNQEKIYVNGVLDHSCAASGNIRYQNAAVATYIGNGSSAFNGAIDEPRIYNTTLTATQISHLYGTPASPNYGYVTTNSPGNEYVRPFINPEPVTTVDTEQDPSQVDPTLYVNNTYNSVGIATANPTAALDIGGTGSTTTGIQGSSISLQVSSTFQNPLTLGSGGAYYGFNDRPSYVGNQTLGAFYGSVFNPQVTGSGTVTSLASIYSRVDNTSVTGGTITTGYGEYIAAPVGSGTITNKYALVTEANAGNVGIGTITPAVPLEVNGIIRGSQFQDRDNINYFIDPASSGTAAAFNGAVGIGTTSIDTGFLLDVVGDIETKGTGGSGDYIAMISTGGGHEFDLYGDAPSAGYWSIYDRTSTAYRLTINSSGDVGIGTTNPQQLLTVGSAGSAATSFYEIGADRMAVNSSFYSYGYICAGNNSGGCTSTGGVVIGGSANTGATADITTGVSFFDGGNVGIGTTNPANVLQISSANQGILLDVKSTNGVAGIEVESTTQPAGVQLGISGGPGWFFTSGINSGDAAILWSSSNALRLGHNSGGGPDMSIDQTGDVHFSNNSQAWPSTQTAGLIVGWNRSGGVGEVNLYNGYNAGTGTAFAFDDMTGGSSATRVLSVSGTGVMTLPGRIFSGAAGTGGMWVDGGSSEFVGSEDSTHVGIYASGWNLWENTSGVTGVHLSTSTSTFGYYLLVGDSCALVTSKICGDLAEIMHPTEPTESGDILITDSATTSGKMVRLARTAYDPSLVGIVSTTPAIVMEEGFAAFANGQDYTNDPWRPAVALTGRVPVKVSTINGPIHIGDPITSSEIAGTGMKATQPGFIVGKALDNFDPANNATGSGVMVCPPGTDPSIVCGKVFVFTTLTYDDPSVQLTTTGDLQLNAASPSADFTTPHYFTLSDALGNPISKMGSFLELVVGNLRAGGISAQEIATNSLSVATDNVSIAGQSLKNYILSVIQDSGFKIQGNNIVSPIASIDELHTNLISPLASGSALTINGPVILNASEGSQSINGDSSQAQNDKVLLQVNGSASVSGTLNSSQLAVNGDATVSGTLHANNIEANSIIGLSAMVGTLSAQNITNVTNITFATPSSGLATNYQLPATGNSSSSSGTLLNSPYALGSTPYASVASYSAYLAYVPNLNADTAMFNQGLISMGATSLSDTTITGQLSIGSQLILANNSINVLGADFQIQSLRQGNVLFEGGLIAIDTDGNLTVNGNAVFSKDLAVNTISPLANDRNVTVQLGQNPTPIQSGPTATGAALATSNLTVQNASGSGIFTVDQLGNLVASGAASIAKLNLNLVQPALALSDTEVVASGSAGTTAVKAHQVEITIDNPLVTAKSLIYITPVGQSTVTPYLLRQVPGVSFTVGIPVSNITDTTFNWLIVN